MKLIGSSITAARAVANANGVLPALVRLQRDAVAGLETVVAQSSRRSINQGAELCER
jgi:hypothetical protein